MRFGTQSIGVSESVNVLASNSTSLLHEKRKSCGLGLLEELLFEQRDLTAAEHFSKQYDSAVPAQAKYYRSLLPASSPGEGEQYASDVDETQRSAYSGSFFTQDPGPDYTFPTTRYRSDRESLANLVPADLYTVHPVHAHWGAFWVEWLLPSVSTADVGLSPVPPLFALVCGLVAIEASTLLLGRHQYAFRAIIGLRHSWLSREILAFGVFAGSASLYAVAVWWKAILMRGPLRHITILRYASGLVGTVIFPAVILGWPPSLRS